MMIYFPSTKNTRIIDIMIKYMLWGVLKDNLYNSSKIIFVPSYLNFLIGKKIDLFVNISLFVLFYWYPKIKLINKK